MEKIKFTMKDYVAESSKVIVDNIKNSEKLTESLVKEFVKHDYSKVTIVASGSSFNSSHCARLYMEKMLGMDVKIVTPFTFENFEGELSDDEFVFVISQSGCSTNSISALKYIKKQGRTAIGITSNPESDFKDYSDVMVDYGIGIETVGYVTKGVIGLIIYLMAFALRASLSIGNISKSDMDKQFENIMAAAELHVEMQDKSLKFIADNYKHFSGMSKVYFCGAGFSYGTALEAGLKVGETVKIPYNVCEAEEYIHGPYLQMTPEYTIFFIDCGTASKRLDELYHSAAKVSDHSFIIGGKDDGDPHRLTLAKSLDPEFTPLYHLPFFQLLAYVITDDLNRWEQHPLLKESKKIAVSKSEKYVDED